MTTDVIISIKTSQSNNAPPYLANGELAYSFSSDKLYIGKTPDANSAPVVTFIGGKVVVDRLANLEYVVNEIIGGTQAYSNVAITGSLRFPYENENAVLATKEDGVVRFVVGDVGEILQIDDNGKPNFNVLNGGEY